MTRTKEQLLSAMTSEGNKKSFLYYNMKLRKEVIEQAYDIYENTSHTAAHKFLQECRKDPSKLQKRYIPGGKKA